MTERIPGEITPGHRGYVAYADSLNWRDHRGMPLPRWQNLREPERAAWEAQARVLIKFAARVRRSTDLKVHGISAKGAPRTLCGMVANGPKVTVNTDAISCGSCQNALNKGKGIA